MHWALFGWAAFPAALIFAQRAEAATSEAVKIANFTLWMGALAGSILVVARAIIQVHKEQMAAREGTALKALADLLKKYEELETHYDQLKADYHELKADHEKTKDENKEYQAKVIHLTMLVVGWAHSELVEIPGGEHRPALTDHSTPRVILTDPAATLPGAGL